jgi:DNA-binding HxlR family transcriptional regulator
MREQDRLRAASPSLDRAWPGEGQYLVLLDHPRRLAILHALRAGALSGAALAPIVGVSERRVRAHMSVLARAGLAVRVRSACRSHRVAWELSPGGSQLLELHDLIVRCEQRLSPPAARPRPLVGVLAAASMRAILRALAGGSLALAELERGLPWIAHTTLEHSLRRLLENGLVLVHGTRSARRYELAPRARGPLALIAVSMVRWRLHLLARRPPSQAGDLPGLSMLLAPVVRVSAEVDGICEMRALPHADVDPDLADRVLWPPAYVAVRRGRISPLPAGSPRLPAVRMRASDLAWCEALLGDDPAGIEIEGDRALARALLSALATALRA